MTKNKIKALLLAVCLMLPTMFMLTSCGHKHTYAEAWSHNETNHWHTCTSEECDETKDNGEHTFGDWTEKTTAGYGVDRVEKHSCTVCGYEQDKTINNSRLEYAGSFFMQVTEVNSISSRGAVLTGEICRGTISVGDKVRVSGYSGELTVAGIENSQKNTLQSASYDDGSVSIIFDEKPEKTDFKTGAIVYNTNDTLYTTFTTTITLSHNFNIHNGGNAFRIVFADGKCKVNGKVKFDSSITANTNVPAGETYTVTIELEKGLPISAGMHISAIPTESKNTTLYFTGAINSIVTD